MSEEKEKEEQLEKEPAPEEEAPQEAAADEAAAEEAPPEVITALQEALQMAQEDSEKNLDGWQRTQADLENYKKRVERDREMFQRDATGRIIKRYLDVLDDLERALHEKPQDGAGAEWASGIELIHRKLLNILESEGVKPIETDGQLFDPNFHEAIGQEDSPDHESGQIIEVIQQGYLIGERVLRPALVRVAS